MIVACTSWTTVAMTLGGVFLGILGITGGTLAAGKSAQWRDQGRRSPGTPDRRA